VTIVLLAEIAGESAYGVNDFRNGVTTAVDNINAAGGILGHKINLIRIPMSPVDNQQATASYLQALGDHPTAVLGLVAGGSQVEGVLPDINRGKVPTLVIGGAAPAVYNGGSDGSPYVWWTQTATEEQAEAGTDYLVKDLHASKVGILTGNTVDDQANLDGAELALKENGQKPFAVATFDESATDLTQQVIAMKGSGAIVDFSYPNPMAVAVKQLAQNGITVPQVDGQSMAIDVSAKLVTPSQLGNVTADTPCDPASTNSAGLAASFERQYVKKWGVTATDSAATSYDDIYLIKAAITEAKSTTPSAVQTAMSKINVKGLVCSPVYKADGAHELDHSMVEESFSATTGQGQIKQVVTEPPLAAGS
jgi:branched-chain amino acid transport system substrate-binding protein